MIARYIVIASVALSCSACATVDFQSMTGASETEVVQEKREINVVEGAVERLKSVFSARGFGAKTSKKKMHAAADMLLNGISSEALSKSEEQYSAVERPISVVLADADIAKRHIDQTTRAAEIYLELVDVDEPVDEELESLQTALLASEKAALSFRDSLPADSINELEPLNDSVDGLRHITDQFGDRVRLFHLQSKAASDQDA